MAFGSYDESDQQNRDANTGDEGSEGVSVHEHEHEGEITFEAGGDTDELVDRLAEIKESADGE